MKILFLMIFTLIFATAFQTASAQLIQPGDITEISLKTGDGFCFDCGRITTLRVDGAAKYHGDERSRYRKGDYTGAIDKTHYARLTKTIVEAGFFDFKPRYEGATNDVASVVVTVAYAGGTKTVENFKRSDDPKFKIVEQAFYEADGKIEWRDTAVETDNQTSVKPNAPTQKDAPRTVTDFYLQMPMSFVSDTEGASERRKRIVVEDTANGYLKLKPTADQNEREYTEIALFKKSSGGYVVGIVNAQCTENCSSVARFVERRADRWTDVTNRVFSVAPETEFLIYRRKKAAAQRDYQNARDISTQMILPREGRTVRVRYAGEGVNKEFELYSATWNGERFAPDEALPEGATALPVISDEVWAAADAAWKPFFERVKIAVKKRDRKTLRTLMSENFSYNCCDEPYPDNRSGAFTTWDGDPKNYAGWKDLDRILRVEPMFDSDNGENRPLRFFDDAAFEFGADGRWIFIGYGASRM